MGPKHMFLDQHFKVASKHMFSRFSKTRFCAFLSKLGLKWPKNSLKMAPKHMFWDQKHDFKLTKKLTQKVMSKNAKNTILCFSVKISVVSSKHMFWY